ncbi:MAG: single-stranded DNA-binding protein [Oscillospiraceae bacterium]|jgi:primosomal replication protein N|nr:single-stranded DNA-binding protein [Oscillospiraceae bacterium]
MINNIAELVGTLAAPPTFSHRSAGQVKSFNSVTNGCAGTDYYILPLEISRLSGATDIVNVIASKDVLSACEIVPERSRIAVCGEVRTFNNKSGVGAKLIISVFAKTIELSDSEDKNYIELKGILCKAPNPRRTPMGREICDLMLAVNRRYGRSDYIPCIAWGRNAAAAAEFGVGDEVSLTGRLQSRKYTKVLDDGSCSEKIAFEVSIVEWTGDES